MHSMTRYFLSLAASALLALTSSLAVSARVLPDSLTVNGVPVLVDASAYTVYATVVPLANGDLSLTFAAPEGDSLLLDGIAVAYSEPRRLKATVRRNMHTLRFQESDTYWRIYFTSLPLVSLTTADHVSRSSKSAGQFTLIDPLKRTDGRHFVFTHRAGFRVRGASTSGYPKKSYAVEMWNDRNEEVDTTVIGFRRDGDVILDAAYIDYSRMRNRVLTDIWNAMDSIPYASSDESKENGTVGHFVEVLLNGKYNGLYCLTDKIDRKKLHLKKLKIKADGSYTQRGLLWKATGWSDATKLSAYDVSASTSRLSWCSWEQKYPDSLANQAYWQPLKDFIDWAAPKLNPDSLLIDRDMGQHVYEQNLANYLLFEHCFVITDNSIKNVYLSQRNTQKDKRVLFTPWDLDSSFGRSWSGNLRDWKGFQPAQLQTCAFFYRLTTSEPHTALKQRMRDTWDRLKHTVLSVDSVQARVKAYADLFYQSGAWAREMRLWPAYTRAIAEESQYMCDFYAENYNVVDAYLSDYPTAIDLIKAAATPLSITVDGNVVTVASPTASEGSVALYDTSGRLLYRGRAALPWRSPQLERGVYIVNVRAGGTLARQKVLVR